MKIEAFDIETVSINGFLKPIVIAFTTKNNVLSKFDDTKNSGEILTSYFLNNLERGSVYYAHNLTFDLLVILPFLTKLSYEYKTTIANYSIYEFVIIENNEILCKLRCSYKISGLNLENLGSLIGLSKYPYPKNLLNSKFKRWRRLKSFHFIDKNSFHLFSSLFESNFDQSTKTFDMKTILKLYSERDAKIAKLGIEQIFKKFSKKINRDRILSSSGLSLQLALNFTKKIKLELPENIDILIRKAYYGGRCEVFGNVNDDETALHFDFKGMYAQCMKEDLPWSSYYINRHFTDTQIPGFYLIAFVQYLDIPILPIRIDEKLKFVNGSLRGWYWFEEINLAIEYGIKVIKIEASITFECYSPILNDFIDHNNRIREEGPIQNLIGKNNNNMLYGRFGMSKRRDQYKIVSYKDETFYNFAWSFNNYKIIKTQSELNRSFTNVALAASISSKARIKLYRGFKIIEKNGGRMLYTDTDSLVCSFKKNQFLNILDKELGLGIKFNSNTVGTVLKDSVFALPKAYSIKFENNNITTELTKIKSIKNLKNSHNKFKFCFYNEKKFVLTQNIFHKNDFKIKIDTVKYELSLNSNSKRQWDIGFKTTKPLIF